MFFFKNDYSEGCHPRILEALQRTNLEQTVGYGLDGHCAAAADSIRRAMDCPQADVHFLCGGTQANLIAAAAFLRPHHCMLAADSGHVNVHETGAIEATGHKVVTLPAPQGKLTPELIATMCANHPNDEHMVKPAMVYLSQSTEVGTIYSKAELEAISACCRQRGLILYVDGARLACGLTAAGCDLTLADLPRLCDAFYIGGTKSGALFGEAMVIVNPALKADFRYFIKQRGAMLAKGRLLGIQFEELFRDDLYFRLGEHANALAQKLQREMTAKGYPMLNPSPTNQIFPILTPEQYEHFRSIALFENWSTLADGRRVIRLVTSWATTEQTVDEFLAQI